MNGNWNTYNEQFMPTETRQNYEYEDNIQKRATGEWLARVRADRQRTAPAPYQPAEAHVTVLPDRQSLKLTRLVTDKEGYAAIPARKAEIVTPHQPYCVLCNKDARAEDAHMVRGDVIYAHDACIAALRQSLEQPSEEKPAQKATPVTKQPTYSAGEEKRIVYRALAAAGYNV